MFRTINCRNGNWVIFCYTVFVSHVIENIAKMNSTRGEDLARFQRRRELENYLDNGIEAGWVKEFLVPRMKNPADPGIRSVSFQKV